MTQTRTLRLGDEAAEELASIAAEDELSVSALIVEALEEAVRHGLDPDADSLPAGSRTVGVVLEEPLLRRVTRAAAEEGLTFSRFARGALGSYLVAEDEEDEDDLWPLLVDREKRREFIADSAAIALRRLVAPRTRAPEPLPSLPAARPRADGTFVVVRDCLHVTQEEPDAAGYVLCSECGRWAPIALPGSIEHQHVVMREQLRRERTASR